MRNRYAPLACQPDFARHNPFEGNFLPPVQADFEDTFCAIKGPLELRVPGRAWSLVLAERPATQVRDNFAWVVRFFLDTDVNTSTALAAVY